MSDEPTIGWSDFAREQYTPTSGNSFTIMTALEVIRLAQLHWLGRKPGYGETDTTRKVVVPVRRVYCHDFFTPFVDLTPDLPVSARITQRQAGEDFFVETYVNPSKCAEKGITLQRKAAKSVSIVLYSAAALLENDGKRSTECEWEIVAILASEQEGEEPMRPLTMARNQLESAGGTKSNYTPEEFARAIVYWSTHKGIKVMEPD